VNRDMIAPLTGVAFVIVVIVSVALQGEPPEANDPVQEIVEHYVDNKDSIMVGSVLSGLAGALLIFFASHLRRVLRAAEGEGGGMLSALALVGATVIAIGATIDSTISFALAEAADDIDPTATQALQALWDNDFLPLAMGVLVFFFASGLSIVLTGALPKWLGWVAILFGIVGVTPAFFIGLFGGALWILVVSVILAMRVSGPAAPPPSPATTP
jgi:hypothetical protein